ncbi:hypothetical protein [Deinococcus cellulosilyticus]|uniref:Uncharacterized protein n=1 Tax=Deinococcus cellulosilyticus (strain DSM 18568 / NBRC 106333 / KACC 11606 / 5516J-15) TaxID=1223518 RepID=A0A511N9X8_DEIC1|nr:hypothetical protein [Deinococcus cellulosilyticus]GEM49326.1 hypothetical protein DC3_49610 [Deinococcus cellulosilyticus NBRC 106333 = KACC 11606]
MTSATDNQNVQEFKNLIRYRLQENIMDRGEFGVEETLDEVTHLFGLFYRKFKERLGEDQVEELASEVLKEMKQETHQMT